MKDSLICFCLITIFFFPFFKCQDDNCDEKMDGYCLTCRDDKFYGDNCENLCNEACPDGQCIKEDGSCLNTQRDCEDPTVWGENCTYFCNNSITNCVECRRDGKICTLCKDGFYPNETECKSCKTCPQESCDGHGICVESDFCGDTKFWGKYCLNSCKEKFLNCEECYKSGLTCYKCLDSEHYYIDEDGNCETCSNCPDQECESDGKCKEKGKDCIDNSYTGEYCNDKCLNEISHNCLNCSRALNCYECTPPYYDVKCSSQCLNCPNKECDIEGNCTDSTTECIGGIYKGDFCNITCDDGGFSNCSKCKRDGACTECKENKFWGTHCEKTCQNCPEGKCNSTNGICLDQNKDCDNTSFYGEKCDIPCEDNCETCNRIGSKCYSCKGNYTFGNKCSKSCGNCPGGVCKFEDGTCYEDGDCAGQKYYGDDCQNDCASISYCELCEKSGELCYTCNDTLHYGNKCEKICNTCPDPPGCNKTGFCNDSISNCLNDEYYGDNCEHMCKELGTNCVKCSRDEECIACSEDQFFGPTCNNSCWNCPNHTCHINGICLNDNNNCFGNKYYGERCDKPCTNISSHCEQCNRNETCSHCDSFSFFGEHCDQPCYCPGEICTIDGSCPQEGNCVNNSFYGEKCEKRCDEGEENINCQTCDRNGKCLSCANDSYHGDHCEYYCETCPSNECYINGTCMDNSSDCINSSYYGDKCDISCHSLHDCLTCNRTGKCTSCIDPEYYGDRCSYYCKYCSDHLCEMNGTCVDQINPCPDPQFYGKDCHKSCKDIDVNCYTCYRNETCSKCLNTSFYGVNCTTPCFNCFNKTCDINGICTEKELDCEDNTFYGEKCDIPCNITNEYCETCNKNGKCYTCKNKGVWGENCTTPCENCPQYECENNGTCVNQIDDCIYNNYTGESCDESCTDINDNCLYCNRKRECTECLNRTQFGDKCNISCENCPGNPGYCNNSGICDNQNDPCDDKSFTGANCSVLCSVKYNNCETCDRDNICFECKNKTKFGNFCEESCENCPYPSSCNISGICDNQDALCIDYNYTGPNCSVPCSVINDNCKLCNRERVCLECVNRTKYGEVCDEPCNNCPGNESLCDVDGICDDLESLCINNSYTGDNCSVLCSQKYNNCLECDRNNTCLLCDNQTFYGPTCEDECFNCPDTCDIDGICLDNTTLCDNASFTGNDCSKLCSEKYSNCFKCSRNNTCFECYDQRKFGGDCEQSCERCPGYPGCYNNGTCYDSNTTCNDDSFTGEECSTPCTDKYPQCKRCERDNTCIECDNKTYYGETCEERCYNCPGNPGYCYLNGTCEDDSSPCDDDTQSGHNCSIACSDVHPNCLRCDRDFRCIECNNKSFYGDNCTAECFNCPGNTDELCNINGTCFDSDSPCRNDNMTGPFCNESCLNISDNCDRCNRDYECVECFNKTYYGNNCTTECFNCPGKPNEDFCYINGTCYDSQALCDDNTMSGPGCNISCSKKSENCNRCDRNFRCIECFNKSFYGDNCTDECFNCPGDTDELCEIDGTCFDSDSPCRNDNMTGLSCNESCLNISDNCDRCNRDYECRIL